MAVIQLICGLDTRDRNSQYGPWPSVHLFFFADRLLRLNLASMANNSVTNDQSTSGHSASLPDDDDQAVDMIVDTLKSRGIFDSFRKDCLSDIDTRAGFQNLTQRINGYVSRFLDKQEWTSSLNKNQLREKLRRSLIDSTMLKYGLDNFVDGAISSKKRCFDPQIRKIVQELLGTSDNDEDNSNLYNGLTGREYSSYDNRYNSYHHSYSRNDRGERNDRDHYYSSHSRRSDYDSNSQMEYDVDNTEQDMEVDEDSSSSTSSRSHHEIKTENEMDSSVQARLDSFLQTFKEVSKQQQQRKQNQSRQESATNSAESASSSDSTDVISRLTTGTSISKPLSSKPAFKFNLNLVKTEPTASDSSIQANVSSRLEGANCDENKDDFSTQDMKLEEVSPNSDLTPPPNDELESKSAECTKEQLSTFDANVNITHEPCSSSLQGKTMPLNAPVTLPPAHLLMDPQISIDDEYDEDEISNSPKAPTPEPISPGPIDVSFEEEEPSTALLSAAPTLTPAAALSSASVKIEQPALATSEIVSIQNPPTQMSTASSQVTRTQLGSCNDSQDAKETTNFTTPMSKEPTATPEASKATCIPENIEDAAQNIATPSVGSVNKVVLDVTTKVKSESENTISPQTSTSTNQFKKEPKITQDNQVNVKSCHPHPLLSQKVTSGNISKSKTPVIKKEPIVVPNVPSVPLEDILSDVSSVHTSDLSDFDDRISISSSEEISLYAASGEQETPSLSITLNSTAAPTASTSGRRKISLQQVKQQLQAGERVTSASSSVASSGGSTSRGVKGKGKRGNVNIAPAVEIAKQQQNVSAKGRRERKINPKYASDEYSSIYNRKKGSGISAGLMEEEIDSDEDFDLQSIEDNANREPVNSPSISVDPGETTATKDLDVNESESTAPTGTAGGEEDEENSNSITSPIDCQSDTSSSTVAVASSVGGNVKKFRKKVQQRQVRYEASDLYKPRPSIGSSRRRNVNNES